MKVTFKEDWAVWEKGDDAELKDSIGASVINRGIAKAYTKKVKAKSKKS